MLIISSIGQDVINEGEEQYVGRSDSSSDDSDDSAEIDLDDVEERDPFTMQRANSECECLCAFIRAAWTAPVGSLTMDSVCKELWSLR